MLAADKQKLLDEAAAALLIVAEAETEWGDRLRELAVEIQSINVTLGTPETQEPGILVPDQATP